MTNTEVVRCVVYYNSEDLPVLCYEHVCEGCEKICFDAVVKIIPIVDKTIEEFSLKELKTSIKKTNTNIDRTSKELKKTVNSLSKFINKLK